MEKQKLTFSDIEDKFDDRITGSNKILVQINASFVGIVNTKMEDSDEKVDSIKIIICCNVIYSTLIKKCIYYLIMLYITT